MATLYELFTVLGETAEQVLTGHLIKPEGFMKMTEISAEVKDYVAQACSKEYEAAIGGIKAIIAAKRAVFAGGKKTDSKNKHK